MKSFLSGVLLGLAVLAIIFAFLFIEGWVIQYLWNGVMPSVFGLKQINIAQAIFLCLLSNLLIKSSLLPKKD